MYIVICLAYMIKKRCANIYTGIQQVLAGTYICYE